MQAHTGRHLSQEASAILREVAAVLEAEGERQTIRAKCDHCSFVGEYDPSGMKLVSLETTTFQLSWLYLFFCLRCKMLCEQATTAETWACLKQAGVPVEVVCGVDECGEIWVRRAMEPLREEDVLGWEADMEELEGLPDELDETAREIADENGRSQ